MKIVRPYARLMDGSRLLDALKRIEWCGRISHGSEDQQTEDTTNRFIENVVMKHGDWSIVEHVTASVDFLVDRGITHELVRHRLASYTQSSTRFINYAKKMPPSFIYPKPEVECSLCLNGDEASSYSSDVSMHEKSGNAADCAYNPIWLYAIRMAETQYRCLLAAGWRPQEARSVFPNALASRIVTTTNLRNWRHLFIMRTTKEAHPQMRQVMIPLLAEFKAHVPLLYDDIVPEARQADNLKLPR